MSDGSLSQDEIDALLAGTGDIDLGDSSGGGASAASGDSLDGLKAALSETVGQQQSNMAMITGKEVEIAPPTVNGGSPAGLSGQMVQITYNFGDAGSHSYVLSGDDAIKFASASMGLDDVELDPASLNAVQEVFSQISGPVINTLSEKTGMTIMPEPANATTVDISEVAYPADPVYARYTVTLGDDSAILYEIFENSFASRLSGGGGGGQQQSGMQNMGGGMPGGQGMQGMQGMPQQGGQMAGMGQNMGGGMGNMAGGGMPGFGGGANVQSVQFPSLQQQGGPNEQGNIGLLMDVYMEMTVELGRTKKLIREILGMGEGTIIELDKLAGEPVDILVNHKLIAKGEVVVIDENFGVRVTEIVSPMERVSDMT
ncbi:MAG: flagellar motor switch protein FliN [Spirochaeta sp.]|jgi:flagellar motor switch protein FliN/FliY|nr:flagellar motor switch protein FliN [Spirochaeta sp.]